MEEWSSQGWQIEMDTGTLQEKMKIPELQIFLQVKISKLSEEVGIQSSICDLVKENYEKEKALFFSEQVASYVDWRKFIRGCTHLNSCFLSRNGQMGQPNTGAPLSAQTDRKTLTNKQTNKQTAETHTLLLSNPMMTRNHHEAEANRH